MTFLLIPGLFPFDRTVKVMCHISRLKKFSDEVLAWLKQGLSEARCANDLHMVQLMPLPLHRVLLH